MGSARFVFRGLVLWLGALVAAMAVAAHGGRFSLRLDVLTHFAPFYLAAGIGVLVVAIFTPLARGKLPMAALGAVTVAASLALVVPELNRPMSAEVSARVPDQVKLIQFNAGKISGGPTLAARWIAEQNPDILVLEEGTPGLRQEILRRLPRHLACEEDCRVAIFSRAAPAEISYPGRGRSGLGPAIVVVRMAEPEGGYTVAATRYTWPTNISFYEANVARLMLKLGPLPKARMILAGDFNSTPWSFARRREDAALGMERRDRALATWPAHWPLGLAFLPIDHVYAGSAWRTVSIARGPRLGSDHYPLIATLALAPSP